MLTGNFHQCLSLRVGGIKIVPSLSKELQKSREVIQIHTAIGLFQQVKISIHTSWWLVVQKAFYALVIEDLAEDFLLIFFQ